ncbi:MAG: gluconate 2-dehydrogenase subunit 3 family protein [Bacteroidota bacterium]
MKRRELLRYTAYATGFALSAPVASALLTGCKAEPEMLEAGFQPSFFSDAEYEYIAKMADAMLPSDGTPGALDVGVPQTIDKMVGEVFSEEDRQKARKGLQLLMKKMDADNPGGFSKLETDKALMYLQDQDLHYKNFKAEVTMSGEDVPQEEMVESEEASAKDAYFQLKSMIIGNYFNSEEVATTMLAYNPVPGEYIPCGDLQELTGGKAWAI